MGMRKQIDLASCASLYVYLSSLKEPSMVIEFVVRCDFSPSSYIFSFSSFCFVLYKRRIYYRGGEKLKIFTP